MFTSRWVLASLLLLGILSAPPVLAVPDEVPAIIEGFLAHQFPGSSSHFWVLNAAQWQSIEEMVVDFHAVVMKREGDAPSQHRYLLLIVAGKLAGAQSIPMDATTDCRPEQT